MDIQIRGNRYFDRETIRERMYLQTRRFLQFPRGRYSGSFLRRDEDAIRNLYLSNGFQDVKVSHTLIDNYRGRSGDLSVIIDIEEGPQSFVHSLRVDGIRSLDRAKILATLSSVPGQPFSEFNVAVDRDTILARYFENGFPNATFEWKPAPAAEPNQIDLVFTIDEGGQQFVRQVLITGNHVTRSHLINQAITLNPGDPLSPTEMTQIQRRLYDLGVFAKVDTAIQNPDGATDHKYVLYNLDEARRYSLGIGVGAEVGRIGGCQACLQSPAGATGFSPRFSFNISRANLWGLTHYISLNTRISTLDRRALLNYSWPRFWSNENLTLSFTGLYQDSRNVRTFNSRRQEGSVQLTQKFNKTITLFYRATYRHVTVSDLKVTPFLISQLSQPVRVTVLSMNLIEDRRDDAVDPHKGSYNTLDLGVADTALRHRRPSYFRFLARNATYHPLTKRLVLARSTEVGNIYGFNYATDARSRNPAARAVFRRRRHFPSRVSGTPGRAARSHHRISAGRHRSPVQPDRAALSADRRQHRRRPVSRHGEHLFEDQRRLLPVPPAQSRGLQLLGARGGVRPALPHADWSRAFGPRLQHQSSPLHRIQGDLAGTRGRRRQPLCHPAERAELLRAAEHQPLPILHFDWTNVLRSPVSIRWMALAVALCAAQAEIIDRIAISVGDRVVTTSDINRDIRIVAFLNGTKPDFSPGERRTAANRLVEQTLVERELEATSYRKPAAAEIEPALDKFRKDFYPDEQRYRAALSAYGITDSAVRDTLLWQRRLLLFVNERFRPGIQLTPQEIQNYFDKEFAPARTRAESRKAGAAGGLSESGRGSADRSPRLGRTGPVAHRKQAPQSSNRASGGIPMTRKRIFWASAILVGLLLVAAVTITSVLRSQWFYDRVRALLVNTVETATGGRVEIGSLRSRLEAAARRGFRLRAARDRACR